MIPFGSQRASGQELATHLLNAHDNEQIEIAELRGSGAADLHGAFAEWRVLARERTRCRKYLYSLSINPDPAQGPLTRAQYADYIARVEDRLGLAGQPRAVVFHVKYGREHCHVIWSRVIADERRAVQISFDREKLMAVTREFARDHGLRLPDGYHRERSEPPANSQLTLYEKVQQDRTGLTREERIDEVTAAWQHSDSPKAFVRALEELGYILATGKRPYVLVDLYGEMNALPKLIAGGSDGQPVRSRDVRAFLEIDFPPATLPTVEQARALAAQRQKAREDAAKVTTKDRASEPAARLEVQQAGRREKLVKAAAVLTTHHAVEFMQLAARHSEAIIACEHEFEAYMSRLKSGRRARAPTGLAAFLGRITGMAAIIQAIQKRKDRARHVRHLARRAILEQQHEEERAALKARQLKERRDMVRRFRALAKIERCEQRSLQWQQLRTQRIHMREAATNLAEATPKRTRRDSLRDHFAEEGKLRKLSALCHASTRAADDSDEGDEDGDAKAAGRPHPAPDIWAADDQPPDADPDGEESGNDGADADDGVEERYRWLVLYDAFMDAAEGMSSTTPWLDDLLGSDGGYDDEIAFEDEDDGDEESEEDDDLDWIFWTLTDEFMRAAWPAGTKGGGSGRSPDELDEAEDCDPDHDLPRPRPKPRKPKPGRPGKN